MIYGSVCSGVEAATVAWHPLGWKPAWFCEFDKFPSAVLAHHYPDVPNLGDMLKIEERPEYERTINLLVGGTPCQSFSVAGLRKGLDDSRGNLALKFCQILRRKQPRWFVWENVPGVLSSNEGRDFAAILSGFSECGYGFAYRILDAQYFGVAQRRRRVFVVGYLGDWRPAAAVLFERESLCGDSAPSRSAGQKLAPCVTQGPPFSRTGNERVEAEALVFSENKSHWEGGPHPSLSQSHNTGGIGQSNQELFSQKGAGLVEVKCFAGNQETDVAATLQTTCDDYSRADGFNVITHIDGGEIARTLTARYDSSPGADGGQNVVSVAHVETMPTLRAGTPQQGPGHGARSGDSKDEYIVPVSFQTRIARNGRGYSEDVVPALNGADAGATSDMRPCVASRSGVRRLTPRECERLQGFPDDYTLIPYQKVRPEKLGLDYIKYLMRGGWKSKGEVFKISADGPRYKAMGNSMAVPVMRWIGERIQQYEDAHGN